MLKEKSAKKSAHDGKERLFQSIRPLKINARPRSTQVWVRFSILSWKSRIKCPLGDFLLFIRDAKLSSAENRIHSLRFGLKHISKLLVASDNGEIVFANWIWHSNGVPCEFRIIYPKLSGWWDLEATFRLFQQLKEFFRWFEFGLKKIAETCRKKQRWKFPNRFRTVI